MSRRSRRKAAARNGDSLARARDPGAPEPEEYTVDSVVALIEEEMHSAKWTPENSKERQKEFARRFGVTESTVRDWTAMAARAVKRVNALEQGTPEHRAKRSEFIDRARKRGDDAFESGHHNASAKFMEIEHVVGGYAPLPPTPQALIVQNFSSVPEYQVFKRRIVSAARRLDADGRAILQRAMAGEFDAEDGNAG